jgi:L-rhamnono-1,4-lactonase
VGQYRGLLSGIEWDKSSPKLGCKILGLAIEINIQLPEHEAFRISNVGLHTKLPPPPEAPKPILNMAEETADYPVIDSHIHLYPASEIDTLAWCDPANPLHAQYSLDEYASATGSPTALEGFIFLETDRKHDLKLGAEDGKGWEMPLMEVDWLKRIALGTPRDGEGHSAEQAKLCLAIVPWAPLPSGEDVLERYVGEVEKHAESSFGKIKGFRYLVQDKPKGVMLQDGFIEGLKWLGKKGYSFDLGVDQHSGGKWQLEEAVEMIEKAHEGVPENEKVTFIISKSNFFLSPI